MQTLAYNFLSSFRSAPGGKNWVSLPQFFKENGYYTTSVGKVFHPNLPAKFDYPQSWSDVPYFPVKQECENSTMYCEVDEVICDVNATTVALERMMNRPKEKPFFLAVGYQAPRLPWSYSRKAASLYPPVQKFPIVSNRNATDFKLEWFRQNEVNQVTRHSYSFEPYCVCCWFSLFQQLKNESFQYSDLFYHPITHDSPMDISKLQEARRAYYSTLTSVDAEFGKLVSGLKNMGVLDNNTIVVFMSDHGQSVGEQNLWSMMSLMETSARVPLLIKFPRPASKPSTICGNPVELVDLYPTLAALSGLHLNVSLPGKDVSHCGDGDFAITQITRCKSCKLAYIDDPKSCVPDENSDKNYTVPCVVMPRYFFSYMGSSIRTSEYRASTYCR